MLPAIQLLVVTLTGFCSGLGYLSQWAWEPLQPSGETFMCRRLCFFLTRSYLSSAESSILCCMSSWMQTCVSDVMPCPYGWFCPNRWFCPDGCLRTSLRDSVMFDSWDYWHALNIVSLLVVVSDLARLIYQWLRSCNFSFAHECIYDEHTSIYPCCLEHAPRVGGGRGVHLFITHETLASYLPDRGFANILAPSYKYSYHAHVKPEDSHSLLADPSLLGIVVPLGIIASGVPLVALCTLLNVHDTWANSRGSKATIVEALSDHHCDNCDLYVMIFKKIPLFSPATRSVPRQPDTLVSVTSAVHKDITDRPIYPPPPLSHAKEASIIREYVESMQPSVFQEGGCTVCGQLTPVSELSRSRHISRFFSILENDACIRKERTSENNPIVPICGPVVNPGTDLICLKCRASVRKGKVPKNALANGLWLGEVPEVLSKLSFVEYILVSHIRHNCCFVRVALAGHPELGSWKMISHVVVFESPISKVYTVLPPPRDELDEVLAIMFTGPILPTEEEMEHTPLLVRHRNVMDSLKWLCLNHCDYSNVELSEANMSTYLDGKAPVAVVFKDRMGNKVREGLSVLDNDDVNGTMEGPCPVVVHGLIGEYLKTKSICEQKTMATRHFKANHGVLMVGHVAEPQSIYNNTSLYPSMFPWLFPYRLGGIGSSILSDKAHKRWLLMYHDKRFQTDIGFPFVAFSHEQVKTSTTGGFLLADKNKFFNISERIHRIDDAVLENISDQMSKGETVVPVTDAEKDCFQLLNDLDHVVYNVHGSLTSKKYMWNEAYSLMASKGAPSWYFTMAPSDHSHPICVYWADQKMEFDPIPLAEKERVRLITQNPVAGARFFNFMVQLFITCVLRVGENVMQGLFGDVSAYYGTIEQQGCLTLHLHMIIWLRNCLSPQQIRDRLLSDDSEFRIQLVQYLESVHRGDYFTGLQETVNAM